MYVCMGNYVVSQSISHPKFRYGNAFFPFPFPVSLSPVAYLPCDYSSVILSAVGMKTKFFRPLLHSCFSPGISLLLMCQTMSYWMADRMASCVGCSQDDTHLQSSYWQGTVYTILPSDGGKIHLHYGLSRTQRQSECHQQIL